MIFNACLLRMKNFKWFRLYYEDVRIITLQMGPMARGGLGSRHMVPHESTMIVN